jgi:hypothetical protein
MRKGWNETRAGENSAVRRYGRQEEDKEIIVGKGRGQKG